MIYIQVEFENKNNKTKKQVDKLQPTSPDKNPEKHTLNIICNKTNTHSTSYNAPIFHHKFIEIPYLEVVEFVFIFQYKKTFFFYG